jgi:Mn2+/Fe2+ NRAMP family transporter
MILLSQEINGLILAAILGFMIVLVNDRRIMGRHVNGRLANVVSGATIVLLVALIGLFLASAVPGSPLRG